MTRKEFNAEVRRADAAYIATLSKSKAALYRAMTVALNKRDRATYAKLYRQMYA